MSPIPPQLSPSAQQLLEKMTIGHTIFACAAGFWLYPPHWDHPAESIADAAVHELIANKLVTSNSFRLVRARLDHPFLSSGDIP